MLTVLVVYWLRALSVYPDDTWLEELEELFGPAATETLPVVITSPVANGKLENPLRLNVPICGELTLPVWLLNLAGCMVALISGKGQPDSNTPSPARWFCRIDPTEEPCSDVTVRLLPCAAANITATTLIINRKNRFIELFLFIIL